MIVRQSLPADALAMAEVLNAIIAIGGTTRMNAPRPPYRSAPTM